MAARISSLLFLLLCVSIYKSEDVNGARDIRTQQPESASKDFHDNQLMIKMVDENHHLDGHDHSSDGGAFPVDNLYLGKTIAVDFPKKIPPSSLSPFWPKEVVDKIPFSPKQLKNLISYFSYSPNSQQAKSMESTLKFCESKPIKGETKFCATSVESLHESVRGVLGLDTPITVLTTTHLTPSLISKQNYTVSEVPVEITAPNIIGCHLLPYPYAVYYCHTQDVKNKVMRVSMVGENGDQVKAIAVCHMDTSSFDPETFLLKLLKIKPGIPFCHFFPYTNLVWVASKWLIN